MKIHHKLAFSDGHSSVRFVVRLDDLKYFLSNLNCSLVLRDSISLSGCKRDQYHGQRPLLAGAWERCQMEIFSVLLLSTGEVMRSLLYEWESRGKINSQMWP